MKLKEKRSATAKPARKANPANTKAVKIRPVIRETVLDKGLVRAWMKTVLSLAKLPGGKGAAKENPEPVLIKISRREMSAIRELWEVFNLERQLINKRLLGTKQQTVAYLLGFHLPNAARLALLWNNFTGRFPGWKTAFQRCDIIINDIGCGTGALAQSLSSELLAAGFPAGKIEVNLSDVASGPLEAAEMTMISMNAELNIKRHCVPVEKLRADRFTLAAATAANKKNPLFIYTLGYVWNELRKNKNAQKNLENILTGHATRNEMAIVFLVEPATELQSRDAMELRDQLVAGGLNALYPCPPTKLCPMLERPKDWCFTEGRWKRPIHAEVIDKALGIDRAWLGASLYVFGTNALQEAISSGPKSELDLPKKGVVVGRPQTTGTSQGKPEKFEYLLCTVDGLKKLAPQKDGTVTARGDILST